MAFLAFFMFYDLTKIQDFIFFVLQTCVMMEDLKLSLNDSMSQSRCIN